MKKAQIHKINRCTKKTNYGHAKGKAPNPKITNFSNIWFNDSSGVEIIELDSSIESKILSHDDNEHSWSYAASYKEEKDTKKAGVCQDDCKENFLADGYNNHSDDIAKERQERAQEINHFRVNNNQYIESDSSSESDYVDADIMDSDDNQYFSDVNYFYNCNESHSYKHDLDVAKQIIHIYSFSNQSGFSENDFTLLNIESRDTPTTATAIEEEISSGINFKRVATPVPRNHAHKKFNIALTPTLPNVTEVREPNRNVLTSEETKTNESIPKTVNTWIINNSNITKNTQDKNTEVVSIIVSPRKMNDSFIKNHTDMQHIEVPPINISKLNPFSDEEIENVDSDNNTRRTFDNDNVKIRAESKRTENVNFKENYCDDDKDELQMSRTSVVVICENNLAQDSNISRYKDKGAQTTDFADNDTVKGQKTVGSNAVHKKLSYDQTCQTSMKCVKGKFSWFRRLLHCKCCK